MSPAGERNLAAPLHLELARIHQPQRNSHVVQTQTQQCLESNN